MRAIFYNCHKIGICVLKMSGLAFIPHKGVSTVPFSQMAQARFFRYVFFVVHLFEVGKEAKLSTS